MRTKSGTQCRPRALTLVVFVVTAAIVMLANLSFDRDVAGRFFVKSYGWPLIWHRYVVLWSPSQFFLFQEGIGWYHSAWRLAANVALWAMILVAPGAACEWLLRRHRPPFRWGLKTQLAVVALAAGFCAWFVGARRRADIQDRVIADVDRAQPDALGDWVYSRVRVERWGPKWLDVVGADRYRRRIVSLNLDSVKVLKGGRPADEQFLAQVAQLPDVQYLSFEVDQVSPIMAAALNDMRKLQFLNVVRRPNDGDPPPIANGLLPPIGKMSRLCDLELHEIALDERSLAGLTTLKRLCVAGPFADKDRAARAGEASLAVAGKCSHLEHLSLWGVKIDSESLASLGGLKHLRTLRLWLEGEGDHFLRHLSPPAQLESVTLAGEGFVTTTCGCCRA